MSISECIAKELHSKKFSGNEINKLLKDKLLIKFMNDDDNNDGMIFKTGLNIYISDFNPDAIFLDSGICTDSVCSGGICVTTIDHYYKWMHRYRDYVRYVTIPDDARVSIREKELICDRVILSERFLTEYFLSDMFEQELISYDQMLEIVKNDGHIIKYINQIFRTDDMMMEAVKSKISGFEQIPQQFRTENMMIEAVTRNGYELQYIPQEFRTNMIMLEAVKQNYLVLSLVDQRFRTGHMMATAVAKSWDACLMIKPEKYDVTIVEDAIKTDIGFDFLSSKLTTYKVLLDYAKTHYFLRIMDVISTIEENIKIYERMFVQVVHQRKQQRKQERIKKEEVEIENLSSGSYWNLSKNCFGF